MTKRIAMHMITALFALAAPGLAHAADTGVKGTFTCDLVDDGKRYKLPAKNIRLEAPVECKLSVAGAAKPEPYAARVISTWTDIDDKGKKTPKKFEHTGTVNVGAPWTATLAPDKDFVGCIDLVIEGVLTAPGADTKPAWSKKLMVKQNCPD